ncbi:MAG: hypothetical protein ACFB6S_13885 [Geminicoccaceae bacterium]
MHADILRKILILLIAGLFIGGLSACDEGPVEEAAEEVDEAAEEAGEAAEEATE